ncbi:peptidase C69 family protein [Thermococcus stetteri]|uniref:hypothetical protein n=1 Tax=Thermococcus stetteri TaxID=49900 RepID=UPI001FD794A8|nr:hypothetical protein [Thermococcus stetteri]
MHYGGLTRPSQTASSQISELGKDVHWFTGTSLPCLSIFKPISFEGGIPESESPTNRYNPKNYWWRIEKFHRLFQTNYQKYIESFSEERDELQMEIIRRAREVKENESPAELTKWAFEREKELVEKWEKKIVEGKYSLVYGIRWKKVNERAGI